MRCCILGGVFLFFSYIAYLDFFPSLPTKETPVYFYSNQTRDDLKKIFQKAIAQAHDSLFIQMYGCTDPDILSSLAKASLQGKHVELYYDSSGSGDLHSAFSFATALRCSGLMHKKIVILDNTTVFLGTANFTTSSLKKHDNLVIGLYAPDLAHFLQYSLEPVHQCNLPSQSLLFWQLPDTEDRCLNHLIAQIEAAQHEIQLAMFTLTHPKILLALIAAQKRGVRVDIAVDSYAAKGASKKALSTLTMENIPVLRSRTGKLLHYKWCRIDRSYFFFGSANWTQAAFSKNEDYLVALFPLTSQQNKQIDTLWKKTH